MQTFKTLSRYLLGALFALAGLNHFVMTDFYVGIVPLYLPWSLALVYLSDVAEAAVGILLLFRRWAVWGGWGIIVVCVAVFPVNRHMAMHSELFPQFSELALWVRLPLQAVVMAWAYWYLWLPCNPHEISFPCLRVWIIPKENGGKLSPSETQLSHPRRLDCWFGQTGRTPEALV